MKNYLSHIPTQKSVYECKDRRERKGRIYPEKVKTEMMSITFLYYLSISTFSPKMC